MRCFPVMTRASLFLMSLCCGAVLAGCVAQRADEVYRQRQDRLSQLREESRQRIPEAKNLTGTDFSFVEQGRALFNGKAVCNGCHGRDAYTSQVKDADVAKLNPAPTDLRVPLGKSVRELYFTIKYGVAGTGMVPVQEDAGLSDEELHAILSYVLALQGQPTTIKDLFSRLGERGAGADQAIYRLCATDDNLSNKARERCEEPYRKRFRTLVTGRPADIVESRYMEIQSLCSRMSDLTQQNQCYRDHITWTRADRASMATQSIQTAAAQSAVVSPRPDVAQETIKTKCAEQWPTDFQMQTYCIEKQQKALQSLSAGASMENLSESHKASIQSKCAKEWPEDFQMRAHCEQQQVKGVEALARPRPSDIAEADYNTALAHCSKQWPDDFKMRAYCIEKQTEAVRKLRSH